MILKALRNLFADLDWQDSPTAAALAGAVDGTGWQLGNRRLIQRSVDGLPCAVLRDSDQEALVASVQMREPWGFVFRGESTPFGTDHALTASGLVGYRFDAPELFLGGLVGGPQVHQLLDALREDRVGVEMHDGKVILTQRGVDPEEAPLLGDAAIALASALRDAWDRLIEAPLEREGMRWDGEGWSGMSSFGEVRVEPGRRLALYARFPHALPEGCRLRPRRDGEPPSMLPGVLGHHLVAEGPPPPAELADERVGEALLTLLRGPGSRLEKSVLVAHFRPWPLGEAIDDCFEALEAIAFGLGPG